MDPQSPYPQYPPTADGAPQGMPPAGAYPQQQMPGQPVFGALPPVPAAQPQAVAYPPIYPQPGMPTQPQQQAAYPAAYPQPAINPQQPQAYQQPAAPAQEPVVYGTQTGQPQPAPAPKSNPNSTQNTLQIAEIRDGIVIMNDGSFRCVVMVKSINFDLMSPEERDAVEYSYQGFLNSLYFDVQIFIRSQKVDIRPYIERLDKIRSEHDNMLLALLMEDYIGYMADIAQHTNIMDKKFYLVIPFTATPNMQKAITQSKDFFTGLGSLFNKKEQHVIINEPDLNKAKDELRNRVQAVLGGLQQCGIQGLPLDTQELIELYYDTYNPDTATRQKLKNFNDLSAPIVTKGQGSAPQPNLDRTLQ